VLFRAASPGIVGIYFLQLTLFGPVRWYSALALDPSRFPSSWWTIVTTCLCTPGSRTWRSTCSQLWMFGPRLEHEWGTRTFVQFYISCGIGGAIAHLLFAQHSSVIGASGAISGVLVAYALRWPDEEVYLFGVIPMRSRWLVAAMLAMNIIFALFTWLADRLDCSRRWNGIRLDLSQALLTWWNQPGERLGYRRCPMNQKDMPRAVPRNRPPVRDRGRGVDEVVARSNAVVLRGEQAAPACAEAGDAEGIRGEGEPRARQDLATGDRQSDAR